MVSCEITADPGLTAGLYQPVVERQAPGDVQFKAVCYERASNESETSTLMREPHGLVPQIIRTSKAPAL